MLTGRVGDDTWETPALRGGKGERVRWMPLVSTWQAGDAASSQPLAWSSDGKKKNRTKAPECGRSPRRAGRRWWEQEGPQGRQEGWGDLERPQHTLPQGPSQAGEM